MQNICIREKPCTEPQKIVKIWPNVPLPFDRKREKPSVYEVLLSWDLKLMGLRDRVRYRRPQDKERCTPDEGDIARLLRYMTREKKICNSDKIQSTYEMRAWNIKANETGSTAYRSERSS